MTAESKAKIKAEVLKTFFLKEEAKRNLLDCIIKSTTTTGAEDLARAYSMVEGNSIISKAQAQQMEKSGGIDGESLLLGGVIGGVLF